MNEGVDKADVQGDQPVWLADKVDLRVIRAFPSGHIVSQYDHRAYTIDDALRTVKNMTLSNCSPAEVHSRGQQQDRKSGRYIAVNCTEAANAGGQEVCGSVEGGRAMRPFLVNL